MKVLTDFLGIDHGEKNYQSVLSASCTDCMVLANKNNTQISEQAIRRIAERFLIKSEFINSRRTAAGLGLLSSHDWVANPKGPLFSERLEMFNDYAHACIAKAYDNATSPDAIVHVTCSGYALPSAIQDLASRKNWNDVCLVHSYHMGCYGAFPAIKIAAGMSGASDRKAHRVDIVHTEMFSPYYDPERIDPSSIIAFSLFADGAIKYSMVDADPDNYSVGLEILCAHEEIIPDSLQDMSWGITDRMFAAFLSPQIAGKIGDSIEAFVQRLCSKAGMDFQAQKEELEYAIHPGGPSILRAVHQNLEIDPAHLARSFDLLREWGNMSSASVPYLLKGIVEDPAVTEGTTVMAVGFGPGLTATGLILRKVSGRKKGSISLAGQA